MNVSHFLTRVSQEGVAVTLSGDDKLKLTGRQSVIEVVAGDIREHKAEIVRYLKAGGRCRSCPYSVDHDNGKRCKGRDDLLPVYGVDHPLRHAPADGGLSCNAYTPSADFLTARSNDEARILEWLKDIGEEDPVTIGEVIDAIRRDPDALEYFAMRAVERELSGDCDGQGKGSCIQSEDHKKGGNFAQHNRMNGEHKHD